MEAIEDPEESKKAEGEADDKKEINDLEEKKVTCDVVQARG